MSLSLIHISLMRLAVIPLCMVGLFYLCGVRGDLLIAMVISASAPTATNTAMYAAKYDNDACLLYTSGHHQLFTGAQALLLQCLGNGCCVLQLVAEIFRHNVAVGDYGYGLSLIHI